ncbi:MAG TPA: YIP1 family protein [Candidatus Angelobacter sp.]|nr:YIP1 family protein [Candidatus Angelobacter sp.]
MSTTTQTRINNDGNQAQTLGLSEAQRLTGTFHAPARTFTDIKRVSRWWVPFLALCISGYVVLFVVDSKIGFDTVTQNAVKTKPRDLARIESLPADQQPAAWATATKITKVISYSLPILFLLSGLACSLALWMVFHFGLDGNVSFGKMFSILVYAWLAPELVRAFLVVVTLLAGANPEAFDLRNPVGTNPGYYMDFAHTPAFIYSALSQIDMLTIWSVFLIGVGVSAVGKVKRSKAIATAFVCWIVWIVVSAGWAAAFS